jgi:hypothetical protein
MQLSGLQVRECGRFRDKPSHLAGMRFIVVDRYPADRASGGTTVLLEGGGQAIFVWDHENPNVDLLGTGRVETKITWPGE